MNCGKTVDFVEDCCQTLHDRGLLPAKDSARYCGMGLRTWLRMVASNLAPQPVRIGLGIRPMTRWRKADLQGWIEGGCQPIERKGGGR